MGEVWKIFWHLEWLFVNFSDTLESWEECSATEEPVLSCTRPLCHVGEIEGYAHSIWSCLDNLCIFRFFLFCILEILIWSLQGHWVCMYKQDTGLWRTVAFDLWKPRVYECMLLWKSWIAKIICSGLERHLTDYVQVHTCVFHYLIALGEWCLRWQIYLLKAKLFGWQDYRMPEGDRDQMLREKERECVMCRKQGEAIKPAGKSRLKCGSNLFCWS